METRPPQPPFIHRASVHATVRCAPHRYEVGPSVSVPRKLLRKRL